MRRIFYTTLLSLSLSIAVSNLHAALITRTYTYTAGNPITANENNTNENTLYTEINGNLNSANLATGGVSAANLAANSVTSAKLDTALAISSANVTNLFGQYILLQSSQSVINTSSATVSTTYIITKSSVTLTPRNAASMFHIHITGVISNDTGSKIGNVTVGYNGSGLSGLNSAGLCTSFLTIGGQNINCTIDIEDKPATTSAVTYQILIKTESGSTFTLGAGSASTILRVEEYGK